MPFPRVIGLIAKIEGECPACHKIYAAAIFCDFVDGQIIPPVAMTADRCHHCAEERVRESEKKLKERYSRRKWAEKAQSGQIGLAGKDTEE